MKLTRRDLLTVLVAVLLIVNIVMLLREESPSAPATPTPTIPADQEKLALESEATRTPPTGDGRSPQGGFTPEERAEYDRLLDLYRNEKYAEAYAGYRRMAEGGQDRHGVLGMVVAALASTHPSEERVKALVEAARANPRSTLDSFVAGVAAHYYAHQSGRTVEEKKHYYRLCIEFLERVRPTYDHEPRTFIYLAVSHFRLGHQREAEQYIEHAVTLANDDPDAYYCRAEIFQRVNVQRSLDDLQKYLDMTEAFRRQGAVLSEAKEQRVAAMRAHLIAVHEGREKPTELFDPVEAEKATPAESAKGEGFRDSPAPQEGESSRPPPASAAADGSRAPTSSGNSPVRLLRALAIAGVLVTTGLVLGRRRGSSRGSNDDGSGSGKTGP